MLYVHRFGVYANRWASIFDRRKALMFEKAEFPIKCGKCGRVTKKTVAWLKHGTGFTCGCGTRIDVDANQFNREMRKVDKSIDDFKRALKRFGR